MPGRAPGECPKCRGTTCEINNCQNPRYIWNSRYKCGCNQQEIKRKNYFTNTHCCKCKSSYPMREMERGNETFKYICKFKCGSRSKSRKMQIKKIENTTNG